MEKLAEVGVTDKTER